MKPICIIPARGNSKRLPRKNILPFKGKPLVANVIGTALDSGVFSNIYVSSEDAEILSVAKNYGAIPYHRLPKYSKDTSTVVQVCCDLLQKQKSETFCCLYATAVLLTSDTIRKSQINFARSLDLGTNVLMGVSEYNYPPVQALSINSEGYFERLLPEFHALQSQQYPKTRVSNGTFYWAKREKFLEEKTFYSSKLSVFDVPESEACDIDTISDYQRLLAN